MLDQKPNKQSIQSIQSFIDKPYHQIWRELELILTKFYKQAQVIVQQECYRRLTEIFKNMGKKEDQLLLTRVQKLLSLLLQQIESLTQCNKQPSINHSHRTTIQPSEYNILQQSLQKAQSEVRKHIRIEQQLKLYLDGVEQKNQLLQKQIKIEEQKYLQLFETVKVIDYEKKQLLRKIKKLQEKTKLINEKDINNHTKLKPHKSVNLITQQLSRVDHSMSMYKSRPILTNHLHSKSKVSQKSSQKQYRQSKCIMNNEKRTKMKQIDDIIQVNLSNQIQNNDSHQQNNGDTFIPTQQDVRLFRQMTKTVQMKQAYKRPVRKITKYKTQSNHGKDSKDLKDNKHYNSHNGQSQCRQYRSVSICK